MNIDNFSFYSREGGDIGFAVYYTSPQTFIISLGWFIKLSVQAFQPLIVIYKRKFFKNSFSLSIKFKMGEGSTSPKLKDMTIR